jgi:hypothetical protein
MPGILRDCRATNVMSLLQHVDLAKPVGAACRIARARKQLMTTLRDILNVPRLGLQRGPREPRRPTPHPPTRKPRTPANTGIDSKPALATPEEKSECTGRGQWTRHRETQREREAPTAMRKCSKMRPSSRVPSLAKSGQPTSRLKPASVNSAHQRWAPGRSRACYLRTHSTVNTKGEHEHLRNTQERDPGLAGEPDWRDRS